MSMHIPENYEFEVPDKPKLWPEFDRVDALDDFRVTGPVRLEILDLKDETKQITSIAQAGDPVKAHKNLSRLAEMEGFFYAVSDLAEKAGQAWDDSFSGWLNAGGQADLDARDLACDKALFKAIGGPLGRALEAKLDHLEYTEKVRSYIEETSRRDPYQLTQKAGHLVRANFPPHTKFSGPRPGARQAVLNAIFQAMRTKRGDASFEGITLKEVMP